MKKCLNWIENNGKIQCSQKIRPILGPTFSGTKLDRDKLYFRKMGPNKIKLRHKIVIYFLPMPLCSPSLWLCVELIFQNTAIGGPLCGI